MKPIVGRVAALAAIAGTLVTLVLAWHVAPGQVRRGAGPSGETAASGVEPPAAPEPAPVSVREVAIRGGDSLVRALAREGVEGRVAAEVARALAASGADLRRLRPRDTLAVAWSARGEAIAVTWEPSPWLGFAAVLTAAGWEVRRAETPVEVRVAPVRGEVRRSVFDAVEDAGEAPQLAVALAEVFASELDFTGAARVGDRFRLLVEKRYADDRFVDYGRILVAQYLHAGRLHTGVGFEAAAGGLAYYDAEGRSLRKSFLKSPLEFTRVTSGFTYARPHPILGGTRPHLAIDYAAPVGTPVRAVADGTVTAAGWDGGNGISVRLRHRAGYETLYNHLSRPGAGVRPGARVSQRQVIGYVGTTGLSTGPHLDYRVAHRGRFVNPLGEKFLPGEPVRARERAGFLRQATSLVRRLETQAPF